MGCFGHKVGVHPGLDEIKRELECDLPKRSKEFTDIWWGLLFMVFIVSLLQIGLYSSYKSLPEILLDGIDSWGNLCGRNKNILPSDMKTKEKDNSRKPYELHVSQSGSKSNINFMDFLQRRKEDVVICVEECPATTISCENLMRNSGYSIDRDVLKSRICTKENNRIVAHTALANKCIPTNHLTKNQAFFVGNVARIIKSLILFQYKFLWFAFCSIGVSASFFGLLAAFPTFALVTNFIVVLLSTLSVLLCTWYNFINKMTSVEQQLAITKIKEKEEGTAAPSKSVQAPNVWRYSLFFAIAGLLVTLLIIVYTAVVWDKRKKIIGFFREAGYTATRLPSLLVLPFLAIAIKSIVIMHIFYVAFNILFIQGPVSETFDLVRFVWIEKKLIITLTIIHLFGCFYVIQVFGGCQRVVVAGMISRWYFISENNPEFNRFCHCFKRLFNKFSFIYPTALMLRYNLGSVCLGSLLIPPLQFGRFTLISVNRKAMKGKYRTLRYVTGGFCGCLWWTQRVLQYVSDYVYMSIAIYGLGFWQSGKKTAELLSKVSHMERAKHAANRALFIGKLGAMLFIGLVSAMFFKFAHEQDFSSQNVAPILINCVIAYSIASCFLSMYQFVFDCLMICYAIDTTSKTGILCGRDKFLTFMAKKRSRRIGWSKQTLSIPIRETNDTHIYIPPPRTYDLVRPKAARGKRRPTNSPWIHDNMPRSSKSFESMSLDGPVETLVDRFDIFVDKMVYEREMSPLSKLHQRKEPEKERQKSLFPPINPTGPISDPSSTELKKSLAEDLKIIDFSDDEKESQKNRSEKKANLSKPVKLNLPPKTEARLLSKTSKTTASLQSICEQNLPGLTVEKQVSDKKTTANKLLEKKRLGRVKKARVHFKEESNNSTPKEVTVNPAEPLNMTTKAKEMFDLKRSCLRNPF